MGRIGGGPREPCLHGRRVHSITMLKTSFSTITRLHTRFDAICIHTLTQLAYLLMCDCITLFTHGLTSGT